MPLNQFYVPPNLYTDVEKEAIAEAITEVYWRLPSFYVVVLFIDVPKLSYLVGGKKTENFVRIAVQHLARKQENDEKRREFITRYEAAIEPFTKGKGIDWELQISEVDRVMWNVNGIAPPFPDTEGERQWIELNRAVPH